VTYAIELIEKAETPYDLIYLLSEKELKILKKYFEENFIKE
jgi:hypothetical protein